MGWGEEVITSQVRPKENAPSHLANHDHLSSKPRHKYRYTVKPEMLAAIIFGGFGNITIWLRFNLAISFEESGWVHIFSIGE